MVGIGIRAGRRKISKTNNQDGIIILYSRTHIFKVLRENICRQVKKHGKRGLDCKSPKQAKTNEKLKKELWPEKQTAFSHKLTNQFGYWLWTKCLFSFLCNISGLCLKLYFHNDFPSFSTLIIKSIIHNTLYFQGRERREMGDHEWSFESHALSMLGKCPAGRESTTKWHFNSFPKNGRGLNPQDPFPRCTSGMRETLNTKEPDSHVASCNQTL